MNIPILTFGDLSQFIDLVSTYPDLGWMFRGQANSSWPLIPKAGRSEYFIPQTPDRVAARIKPFDLGQFKVWRENAVAYCEKLPENDFECLAFAQHYGLATRLLDWSKNPLVALYFAVEDLEEVEGAVYGYLGEKIIDHDKADFLGIGQVAVYIPRPFDRRVLGQSGVFTYHPEPSTPLKVQAPSQSLLPLAPNGTNLIQLSVKPKCKDILRKQLSRVGISRKSLFPDLEGLSDFVNWQMKDASIWHHNPNRYGSDVAV